MEVNDGGSAKGVDASVAATGGGTITQEVTAVETTTVYMTTSVGVAAIVRATSGITTEQEPRESDKEPVAAEASPRGGAN